MNQLNALSNRVEYYELAYSWSVKARSASLCLLSRHMHYRVILASADSEISQRRKAASFRSCRLESG